VQEGIKRVRMKTEPIQPIGRITTKPYVEPPYWPTWQEGEAPTQDPPYPKANLLDATPL